VPQPRLLGTAATWYADVTLLLEIGMGIGLLAGAFPGAREMLPGPRCLPVRDRVTQCGTHCAGDDSFLSASGHSQASLEDRHALLRVRHGACSARRHCRTWGPVHFVVGGNEVAAGKNPHHALQILDAKCSYLLVARSLVGNSHLCALVRAPAMKGGLGESTLIVGVFYGMSKP
jgi:hypothetical protein